tara:strand:+ start:103 stop:267 length:165 start_codon:yes stop_codon:yes gene_type:complete
MKKYFVSIIETINYNYKIEAKNRKEAENIAFERMTSGEGFLDKDFIINVDNVKN